MLRPKILLLALVVLIVGSGLSVGLLSIQSSQRGSLRHIYTTGTQEVAGFVEALFLTTQSASQRQRYAQDYGDGSIDKQTLIAARTQSRLAYIAITTPSGRVLAKDGRPAAPVDPAIIRQSLTGSGVGVGEPRGGVIPLAIAFPVGHSRRVLVQETPLASLSEFFEGVLRRLPLKGGSAVILSRDGVVLAGVGQRTAVGVRLTAAKRATLDAHPSAEAAGRYYVTAPILSAAWRVVLVVETSALYRPLGGTVFWFPWAVVIGVLALLILCLVLVVRSASQSKRLEELLARSSALVIDLEQVASATSHDIRGSLRRMVGFAMILDRDYSQKMDERGKNYLKRIARSGERLDQLTGDLVEYARAGDKVGPRRKLDTKAIIEGALELLDVEGATIEIGKLPSLFGNATAIKQVFQNLIGNSLKFHRENVSPRVEISGYDADGFSYIRVRDNGIGIPPQWRERVFEPFQRLDPSYEGTGIGLALVKRTVARHGGSIRVVDTDDAPGTTIEFRLPHGE